MSPCHFPSIEIPAFIEERFKLPHRLGVRWEFLQQGPIAGNNTLTQIYLNQLFSLIWLQKTVMHFTCKPINLILLCAHLHWVR